MEISDPKIKKFLYFLKRKLFLYFRKRSPALFKPKLEKLKKIYFQKNSLHFGQWNFLPLILKISYFFLEKKLFLYFGNQKPRKNTLHLRKQNFLIFQETSYIRILSELEKLKTPTSEKFLIFRKMKLSSPKFKKTFYFYKFLKINLYILHHNILHQNYYRKFPYLQYNNIFLKTF